MKHTKSFLCALLALCIVLSLYACAGRETITVPKETTEAPTTEAPATEAPTTEAPASEAPTTEAPASEAPTTEAPASEAPETEEPTSEDAEVSFDSPYADAIVGTWEWNLDMSTFMIESLSQSMGMDISERSADLKFDFSCIFEFAANGTCKVHFDEDKLSTTFNTFLADFCVVLTEVTYETVAQQGVSKEDADANFMSQYGCSIAEYFSSILTESLDLTSVFGQLPTLETTYKLEGDQLTMAQDGVYHDDAATISIDGDTMTLDGELDSSILADFASYGIELPITLTRR